MASRKYLGDYRLENVEKNGKLKTVAVYRGKHYGFRNPEALRKERPKLIACAAAFWFFQLAALTVRTRCAHYIFVIMPMAFAMLPFWFTSMGLYTALTVKGSMIHEQADKLESRFSGGSLIAAALSGAALTGSFVVFFLIGQIPAAGDILFVFSAAAQTLAAVLCFRSRSCLKTEVVSDD